jgi:hypothetical protein
MANVWFVQVMGVPTGPLSDAQLREMAATRLLTPDDVVRKGVSGDWVTAGRVRGLFGQSATKNHAAPAESRPMLTSAKAQRPFLLTRKFRFWPAVAAVISIFVIGTIATSLTLSGIASLNRDSDSRSPVTPTVRRVHFDLKGVKLGDPLTREFALAHGISSFPTAPDSECIDSVDFGSKTIIITYYFDEYKLVGIMLYYKSELFNDVLATYTTKFGTPPHDVSEEVVTNAFGAVFKNTIATWETVDGQFVMRRYGTSIDHGYAIVYSPAYTEMRERKEAERNAKLKNSL